MTNSVHQGQHTSHGYSSFPGTTGGYYAQQPPSYSQTSYDPRTGRRTTYTGQPEAYSDGPLTPSRPAGSAECEEESEADEIQPPPGYLTLEETAAALKRAQEEARSGNYGQFSGYPPPPSALAPPPAPAGGEPGLVTPPANTPPRTSRSNTPDQAALSHAIQQAGSGKKGGKKKSGKRQQGGGCFGGCSVM